MAFTQPRIVKDRIVQHPTRFNLVLVSGTTYDLVPVPGTITEEGTALNKAFFQPIEDKLGELLFAQDLKGTTQTPTYTGKNITQIVHKDAGNVIVRTDVYTYTPTLITEVRTLAANNATMTFKYYFNADGSYNRMEVI
jgi:hypothetical protein